MFGIVSTSKLCCFQSFERDISNVGPHYSGLRLPRAPRPRRPRAPTRSAAAASRGPGRSAPRPRSAAGSTGTWCCLCWHWLSSAPVCQNRQYHPMFNTISLSAAAFFVTDTSKEFSKPADLGMIATSLHIIAEYATFIIPPEKLWEFVPSVRARDAARSCSRPAPAQRASPSPARPPMAPPWRAEVPRPERVRARALRADASETLCRYRSTALTFELATAAPLDRASFTGLVLGCIEAKFCK